MHTGVHCRFFLTVLWFLVRNLNQAMGGLLHNPRNQGIKIFDAQPTVFSYNLLNKKSTNTSISPLTILELRLPNLKCDSNKARGEVRGKGEGGGGGGGNDGVSGVHMTNSTECCDWFPRLSGTTPTVQFCESVNSKKKYHELNPLHHHPLANQMDVSTHVQHLGKILSISWWDLE